jgi:hypothetical protein
VVGFAVPVRQGNLRVTGQERWQTTARSCRVAPPPEAQADGDDTEASGPGVRIVPGYSGHPRPGRSREASPLRFVTSAPAWVPGHPEAQGCGVLAEVKYTERWAEGRAPGPSLAAAEHRWAPPPSGSPRRPWL